MNKVTLHLTEEQRSVRPLRLVDMGNVYECPTGDLLMVVNTGGDHYRMVYLETGCSGRADGMIPNSFRRVYGKVTIELPREEWTP